MVMRVSNGEYFGAPVERREIDGLILTEKRFPPGFELPVHTHDTFCFCTILQGAMQEDGDGMSRLFEPVSTVFHPSGEIHRDRVGPAGIHIASLEFGKPWQDRLRQYSQWLLKPALHKNNPVAWLGMRIRREYYQLDVAAPLALEALALELISRVVRAESPASKGKPPGWLRRIEQFLDENFEGPLTMNELSRIAGVHQVHVVRTFRKFHGTTVGEYLRRRRIEYAGRLLRDSKLSVVEVAARAGFYDQSHFTRTFRAIVGLTPGQFRSQTQPQEWKEND